ncbi:hypothetical protein [Pseudomonas sp. NCCP-436]|uniref:hypothetical protein n=1 Tax=Pseudomonas sp. NCCP-436 TaxID=2842481 RepID=UPI001C804F03|nr:hypothetical protein [Pseudomonas sp. NCCP-436]GIZ13974.1 hypothetical protein NCCP436_33900 [Pseudomonas sp. NCCP-436]
MQHITTRELSPVEIEAFKQRLIEEAEESRRDRRRMETMFDGFRDCVPVDEELEAELTALDSLLPDTQVRKGRQPGGSKTGLAGRARAKLFASKRF